LSIRLPGWSTSANRFISCNKMACHVKEHVILRSDKVTVHESARHTEIHEKKTAKA
jgi:hypothetical protein